MSKFLSDYKKRVAKEKAKDPKAFDRKYAKAPKIVDTFPKKKK